MMSNPRKIIAIRILVPVMLLLAAATPIFGGVAAGTVIHVSGTLAVQKGDGGIKALSVNSVVEEGDLLVTEKRTYASIKMRDNSEFTLRPNSRFKVEKFGFDKGKPEEDKAVYNLIKGGLRTVTGQIGKRSAPESYQMKTPTATIGIRGTSYGAVLCLQDCAGLPDGLYVDVVDGKIQVSNQGGAQTYAAGQFGFVAGSTAPPALLPARPAAPQFIPPPSEPQASAHGGAEQEPPPPCEVR